MFGYYVQRISVRKEIKLFCKKSILKKLLLKLTKECEVFSVSNSSVLDRLQWNINRGWDSS